MEILSDAVFKGNVSVKGRTAVDYLKINSPEELYDGDYITASEFSLLRNTFVGNHLLIRTTAGIEITGDDRCVSTPFLNTNFINPSETTSNDPIYLHKGEWKNLPYYGFSKPSCISVDFSTDKVNGLGICMSGKTVYIPIKEGTVALTSDIPSLSDYQKKFTTFSSPSVPANCTAFEFTGTAISDSNKTHLIQVQNTSTGKSVIAETWMTANKKPAMSFAGCTSTVAAGTYTAIVL